MGKDISAISRRDFLQLTAKNAIYSAAFLTGCAPMATDGGKKTARAIDIHHHYFPAELINEIKQHGKSLGIEYLPSKGEAHVLSFGKGNRTGVDPEIIDVDKRLEVMRDGRVAIATAESQPSAQGYSLDGKQGEAWSRLYNEGIHNLVNRYPQRFVGMATVPLQDPVRAASVLDYAIRELKFSGVTIGSNVKIQNNVSVYTGVVVEDDVFLGPSCVLTNVSNPRSQVNRHSLYERTVIRRGATVGSKR